MTHYPVMFTAKMHMENCQTGIPHDKTAILENIYKSAMHPSRHAPNNKHGEQPNSHGEQPNSQS